MVEDKRSIHLAGHLLKQGSFYPIYPPAENLPLDSTKLTDSELPYVPDVCSKTFIPLTNC